ncbi:MAG: alpha/beta hydrolase [Promethearchaeota archaeon]
MKLRFNKKFKRIALICALFSLFIIGTILIYIIPISVKIIPGQTVITDDGVTIYFNVYEPVNGDDVKNAIILGHGGSANKEFMKGYAIEMAAAGFVAVTLDFRGHGQSMGEIDFSLLANDVRAVKDKYLAERGDINMSNLGYLGYSMGGWPGNEIVKEDEAFKCFILVGSSLLIKKNEIDNRSLNILMIQARYDEAHTLEKTKGEMGAWLGMNGEAIDANKLYGDFNANASKIYLDDNSDHLTLSWDTDFIREARNWVINTFDEVRAPEENFFAHFRILILIMQTFGGLGVFFLIIKPLSQLIINPREGEVVKIEEPNESISSLSKNIMLYSLVFGIPGMLLMIWVLFVLPLVTAGLFTMLLFGQAFGILLLLRKIAKNAKSSLKEYLMKPFKISRNSLLKHVVLGLILGGILYLILILTFGLNYIGMIPSIIKIPWILIYFAFILFVVLIQGIFLQLIYQTKLKSKSKGLTKTALFGFMSQIIYLYVFILAFSMITNNYFTLIFLTIATPVTLLSSFVLVFLYKNSGNIIAGAIIVAFIIICLLCTLAPFSFSIGSSAPYLSI